MWLYIVLIIVVLFAIWHYTKPKQEPFYGYAFYGDNDEKPLFWGKWFNQHFYRNEQENNNKLVNLYR